MTASRRAFRHPVLLLLPLLAGCGSDGPELASVEGTVKLDGRPVADALIMFTPVAGGRPAGGRTDGEGRYELTYSRDAEGAMTGEHTVTISTFRAKDPDSGTPGAPELVPAVYNTKTELKKTVEPGDNVIDFDLDSKKGKIVQPRE